jgi:hypothetical protein
VPPGLSVAPRRREPAEPTAAVGLRDWASWWRTFPDER